MSDQIQTEREPQVRCDDWLDDADAKMATLLARCFPLEMLLRARAYAWQNGYEREGRILSAVCAEKEKAKSSSTEVSHE